MDNTVVRRLRSDDAKEVSRISSSITGRYSQKDFRSIIEKQAQSPYDASFVAERENQLAGFCLSYILPGSFGIEKSAWLALIAVSPDFMGQGIGKMLAKETLKHYKEQGVINVYASVKWDATDLLSFFKTLGFRRSDFINLYKELD